MLVRFWRNWDPCAVLVGMKNGTAPVENSLVFPQKVKHRVTIRPSNSTPRYMPKRTENICSSKIWHTNTHSIIIHKSQKSRNNLNAH